MAVSSRRNTFDQASWAGRRPMVAFVRGVTIDELRTVGCAEVLHGSGFPIVNANFDGFFMRAGRNIATSIGAYLAGADQGIRSIIWTRSGYAYEPHSYRPSCLR